MSYRLAFDLIQRFEGCRLTSYPDPGTGGMPYTVGWGSTYIDGKPVKPNQTITQVKADQALLGEVARIAQVLALKVPGWSRLNVNQQCALISFSFNLGANWYGSPGFSTITRTIKEGRLKDVPAALLLYRNPGTNVEAGLRRRRIAEGVLWAAPVKP